MIKFSGDTTLDPRVTLLLTNTVITPNSIPPDVCVCVCLCIAFHFVKTVIKLLHYQTL